jgi:hypothetical protein
MDGSILRFDDIRLGQPVPLTDRHGATAPIGDRICEMVRQWSGAPTASLVSIREERAAMVAANDIAASVVGRHLGGSNRADVEVLMQVDDVVRARAVVRVTLA